VVWWYEGSDSALRGIKRAGETPALLNGSGAFAKQTVCVGVAFPLPGLALIFITQTSR
jgi:hypothetical protein